MSVPDTSVWVSNPDGSFAPYVPPADTIGNSGVVGGSGIPVNSGITADQLRYGATPSTTIKTSQDISTWDQLLKLVDVGSRVYLADKAAKKPGDTQAGPAQDVNRTRPVARGGSASDSGITRPSSWGAFAPAVLALVFGLIGYFVWKWLGLLIGLVLGFVIGMMVRGSA